MVTSSQGGPGSNMPSFLHTLAQRRDMLVPIGFLALIGVLVVPLHPTILDMLICANIALAAIVLLTTIQMRRPLDFSVFPALLLATTLFRLVLNVASTRLILSADASTPDQMEGVAGRVIDAFAIFVAGNDAIVGGIIFIILVVVQFVVITKGATRMSEVAARFTLDAMPGKQMAIDADLSSGLITENEARTRRDEVTRESDFYGAMDGASKFVRGDAIAGIVITLVNVIGGVAIGIFDNGLSAGQALTTFGMLAIGDGLVSQIPAFVVAIAAGLIVARAGGGKTIGDAIPAQLVSQPAALLLIAVFFLLIAFTGLPTVPLLIAGGVIGFIGFMAHRSTKRSAAQLRAIAAQESTSDSTDQPVEDLLGVDTMEIEIGYALVQLVDVSRGGDLLERITMIRRQLAVELGVVLPPVRIRDNVQLPSEQYNIRIRGAVVGEGTVHPGLLMAMDSGLATSQIAGVHEIEPAFGLEAIWIEPAQRSQAENANYTVVDAESVLATHLTEIARSHADELLTREEVSNLLAQLKERAPKLVEEAVPGHVKPGDLQKVLQALLRERVPIRDLETILETLSDWAPHTNDPEILVEYVRNALRRTICARYTEPDEKGRLQLHCVTMDPAVEDQINAYVDRSTSGTTLSLPPQLGGAIARAAGEATRPLLEAGRRSIVVTSPSVRAQVRQIILPHLPDVIVLGYNEIALPGIDVESVGLVQVEELASEAAAEGPMVGSV